MPGTSSSENLAFHGDKMGRKDHCRVTTGRIKAKNSAERLPVYLQRISVTSIILSNNAFDINIACLLLRSVISVAVLFLFLINFIDVAALLLLFGLFCLLHYME